MMRHIKDTTSLRDGMTSNYGASHEIDAYRVQFAVNGFLKKKPLLLVLVRIKINQQYQKIKLDWSID